TPRRPSSEIDRFLDEVNRRRRQAAERQKVQSPRPAPSVPTRTTTRPARPPASKASATPPTVRPSRERVPVRTPVVEAVVVEDVAGSAKPPAGPGAPFASPPAPVPTTVAPAPAMDDLASLLGTADSLRMAFILQEVLGPPRCRRQGR